MKLAPQDSAGIHSASNEPPVVEPAVDAAVPEHASGLGVASPAILLTRQAPPPPITLDKPARVEALRSADQTCRSSAVLERDEYVPEGAVYSGEVLRRAREARGLTVEQMCERTRITRQHIDNLEADRYERLPAPVYLRGMLMALAKQLRLDGQKVARSYLELVSVSTQHAKSR